MTVFLIKIEFSKMAIHQTILPQDLRILQRKPQKRILLLESIQQLMMQTSNMQMVTDGIVVLKQSIYLIMKLVR